MGDASRLRYSRWSESIAIVTRGPFSRESAATLKSLGRKRRKMEEDSGLHTRAVRGAENGKSASPRARAKCRTGDIRGTVRATASGITRAAWRNRARRAFSRNVQNALQVVYHFFNPSRSPKISLSLSLSLFLSVGLSRVREAYCVNGRTRGGAS